LITFEASDFFEAAGALAKISSSLISKFNQVKVVHICTKRHHYSGLCLNFRKKLSECRSFENVEGSKNVGDTIMVWQTLTKASDGNFFADRKRCFKALVTQLRYLTIFPTGFYLPTNVSSLKQHAFC